MIGFPRPAGLNVIGLGLAASALWGASDFLGGLATRRSHVFLVVAIAHSLSLGLLLLVAWAMHSSIPAEHFAFLGLGAGTLGGVALILYYQALSLGEMGLTTTLTGVLTAMIPIGFSFLTQGLPKISQIAGFVMAGAAIALVAYAPAGKQPSLALGLAALAGVCFGAFLVVLKVSDTHSLLWQLIFSRCASAGLAAGATVWAAFHRGTQGARFGKQGEKSRLIRIAGAAGVLEATGTLLYMQSANLGRLDVAAVLTSLYPVVTILLAMWVLKERTTPSQAVGMALALGAVVLVST
jgi:drug/metabolite transporter (DMT)-like permease